MKLGVNSFITVFAIVESSLSPAHSKADAFEAARVHIAVGTSASAALLQVTRELESIRDYHLINPVR
jgi:hypothetical protein